jgi:uncharacterized protein YeaC (DUF1315 family)
MDNLILQARLFEKQMQQGGEQQDANGDGLDDKTGQPIKRVTTITEDINNKTGQVASKETKTKVINPTAEFDAQQADNRAVNGVATNLTMKSKDELINHFLLKNSNNDIEKFLPAVGAVAGAGARMAGKGLLGAAKFGLGSAVKKPAKDNQQADNPSVDGAETDLTMKSKDELINHFLLKNAYVQAWGRQSPDWYSEDVKTNERGLTTTNNDPNSVGAKGVGPLALRDNNNSIVPQQNNNQPPNNQNPSIIEAEFTEEENEEPLPWPNESPNQPTNQPTNQPPNQKPGIMDRMKGAAKGAAKFGAHAALGMATGGIGNYAYHKYNQSKQNAPGGTTQPPDPTQKNVNPNDGSAAYMPVGSEGKGMWQGIKNNAKNMAQNYATGVMETGKLTGQEGGAKGMWNTMTSGGAIREGMTANQTWEDREDFGMRNETGRTMARNQSFNPPTPKQQPTEEEMWQQNNPVQNSYDLESKIYDLYSLQKQQSYYREIDSTEAIRFAHS